jgi:hypothetical protein
MLTPLTAQPLEQSENRAEITEAISSCYRICSLLPLGTNALADTLPRVRLHQGAREPRNGSVRQA